LDFPTRLFFVRERIAMLAQSLIMIRKIANRFFATSSPTLISGRRLSPRLGPTDFTALLDPSVKRIDNADVKGESRIWPRCALLHFSAKGRQSRAQLDNSWRR
jgi:hypothetical protein